MTQTHGKEGLVLKGMRERNRVLEYLDAIVHYLETLEYESEEESKRLADYYVKIIDKSAVPVFVGFFKNSSVRYEVHRCNNLGGRGGSRSVIINRLK